jgi:crotonobetainyl-CoA:carnitine CoA-transferase CaiB-like acyl-CoA transferase
VTTRTLQGVRIVDMTEVWAGPMGTSLLGDLGADVVKVESFPRRSSITRASLPGAGDTAPWERGALHHMANRNKRNFTLNIRTDEGADALRKLITEADVLVEGYSAGTIERLGFGWDAVRELNPNLVMLSMPGWGGEGPYRGYVTLGSGLDSTAGHAAMRGYPDRPLDEIPAILQTDATGALAVVQAVLSGLFQREQTNQGVYIDMSQAEGFQWQLAAAIADYTLNGRVPERLGNRDPQIVPHGCYRANGGEATEVTTEPDESSWVVIEARTDAQWLGVATAAGHPEWAILGHPWATVIGRLRARTEVDAALAAYAATNTAEAISDAVSAAGGIAAPVKHQASFLSDPQFAARAWMQPVEHRYMGLQIMPGFLWSIVPDAPSVDIACGLLGEYNTQVLTELGYTEDEIAALEAAGVIGNAYPS